MTSRSPESLFGEVAAQYRKTPAVSVRLPVKPSAASRPRVTRQGWAYYAKPYKTFLKEAKKRIPEDVASALLDSPLLVFCTCVAQRPKTTKLPFPKPDIDNYAKGPLDVFTKSNVWVDDWLVEHLVASKRWSDEDTSEGVYIHIFTRKKT